MTEQEKETRDKFLTEAMGECWHEVEVRVGLKNKLMCYKCGEHYAVTKEAFGNPDFSTWTGFGKLWEWFHQQPKSFKYLFILTFDTDIGTSVGKIFLSGHYFQSDFINPDNFANALYQFLQQEEP